MNRTFAAAVFALFAASPAAGADLDIPRYGVTPGAGLPFVTPGGSYRTGLFQGTAPRGIERYYERSGVRSYFERHHNRYDNVPAVAPSSLDIPVLQPRSKPPRYRRLAPNPPDAHIGWCRNAYRSYRASDDSYQPLAGPRRRCLSPFG